MLEDASCWAVSGVRTAEEFFRAVADLVPDATHVYLEGAPSKDIVELLTPALDDVPYSAPIGTYWSWPKNRRFAVRASRELLMQLSAAGASHAEPEICSHIHFYRGPEALVQWFDAFDDPLQVSKRVERKRVQAFATLVGGVVADGAA